MYVWGMAEDMCMCGVRLRTHVYVWGKAEDMCMCGVWLKTCVCVG